MKYYLIFVCFQRKIASFFITQLVAVLRNLRMSLMVCCTHRVVWCVACSWWSWGWD